LCNGKSEKLLNPGHAWLLAFFARYHYTKFGIASIYKHIEIYRYLGGNALNNRRSGQPEKRPEKQLYNKKRKRRNGK
jgi:hypothetical protein